MGSFPSRRAADWCACTMSLYIGASRRLIGMRTPIYRRSACNELINDLLVSSTCKLWENSSREHLVIAKRSEAIILTAVVYFRVSIYMCHT